MLDDLEHQYRLRFQGQSDYRDRVWKILTRDFFQAHVPREGSVLDLGCGWGEFINNIDARVRYGMDLNGDSADRLAPGITFLRQDCSETWPLPDNVLDVVFSSNFLEHLRTKDMVHSATSEARRCLKPGGRLICMGPNIRYLPGAYWDFWDHYVPLTERSLAELLKLVGLTVATETARFLPYTMSRGVTLPVAFVAAYLRVPLLWPLFGRQFLVIAEKR